MDSKPFDYLDCNGEQHVMAACGHRVSGAVTLGDKILACPNCYKRAALGEQIILMHPDRIPSDFPIVNSPEVT